MDEMKKIVICKHCGKPEYYGEMRWLSGFCGCRDCYKTKYEDENRKLYSWDDLNGERPTMAAYAGTDLCPVKEMRMHPAEREQMRQRMERGVTGGKRDSDSIRGDDGRDKGYSKKD